MNPLPWFKTAGYLITTRHNRKGVKYNHNEHLPHGDWFIPVLDYTDELNLDIMKVIKKHFDTSNGVLELPYAFAGKDIPELHEIAGKPSLLAQKWFEDKQSEEEEIPPTQDDGKTLPP